MFKAKGPHSNVRKYQGLMWEVAYIDSIEGTGNPHKIHVSIGSEYNNFRARTHLKLGLS